MILPPENRVAGQHPRMHRFVPVNRVLLLKQSIVRIWIGDDPRVRWASGFKSTDKSLRNWFSCSLLHMATAFLESFMRYLPKKLPVL